MHLGECLVVLPTEGEPHLAYTTDMERGEAAATGLELLDPARLAGSDPDLPGSESGEQTFRRWRAALRECQVLSGRVALAGTYAAGRLLEAAGHLGNAGYELFGFGAGMRRARKRKSASERAEIARVAMGTCAAMRAVARTLSIAERVDDRLLFNGCSLTAGHLRRVAREVYVEYGLQEPRGNIISAGRDAALPHSTGDDARELRAAEAIVVDLFPKGDLYADCTRTFCIGQPPTGLVEAHRLVREALSRATEEARSGIHATRLQEHVCDRFEASGWDTPRSKPGTTRGYVHGLGHGVGRELHELPAFRGEGVESRLAPGDVFTLEPGIYDPQAGFGVRLEDLFLLGSSGPRCLTTLPYDLDPASW